MTRMLDTLACRGPDDEGVWQDADAVMGHRRLAVIDRSGGVQPMTDFAGSSSADPHVVLAYNGEIDNFMHVRRKLTALGHTFRTRSDTEVVLRAYQQWSERFVDYLDGMFAIALWNPRRRRLVLARDRLGIKPLYYARSPHALVFGSEPKALLEHPSVGRSVDLQGLADLLSLSGTADVTPYRDIRELPPATIATIDPSKMTIRPYWKLTRREHADDDATTAATVSRLLGDAVARNTVADDDVPLCGLLSGGLDSSAIAAFANTAIGNRTGRPLHTFAVDFVGADTDFRSDDFRPERDTPYALKVADHLQTAHRTIELAAENLGHHDTRLGVLAAQDVPRTFGDVDASLMLLFREIRRHSTVALSGEAADELFGGYSWFHDAALPEHTFPWLSRMQLAPLEALTAEFRSATAIDDYRIARHRDAVASVDHLPGDTSHERRMREMIHLHLTRWLPILLERKDRLSMASGLEVRVPFCDRQLVEYVYNVPWSVKTLRGEPKGILKAAVEPLLPSSVLRRRKSPYPTTADPRYEKDLRRRARALINSQSPAMQILDRNALTGQLRAPEGHLASQLVRNTLESAVILDAWFDRYKVHLP